LNQRHGLIPAGLIVVKFGLCDDESIRLKNMQLGWEIKSGERGPPLARKKDWKLFGCGVSWYDEQEILRCLSARWPESYMFRRLRAEMVKAALRSKVCSAEKNLNGVGELRYMDRKVVFSPEAWSAELGIVRPGAMLALKKSCEFLQSILVSEAAGDVSQAA
jgi:hypothetical protein